MIKSTASKVMWVGRATVFLVGLSVILALMFGVASAAFAGNLDPLKLGTAKNVATRITTLVGKVATGSALVVKNPSGGPALGLQVNAGQAPLTVNADAGKATNLNADQLDGKDSTDFLSGTGSVTSVDEQFSDPDGVGGAKGFSNTLSVPGAQIRAACLQQSSGIEMFLNRTNDVSAVSLWRDDGGANPTVKTLQPDMFDPSADSDSSPVSAGDHVIWHGSSTAGTFTAVLFTRYEGGSSCRWSGYVLSN